MTFIYIAFLYVVALLMAYENLFAKIALFLGKDGSTISGMKWRIFNLCYLSLKKVRRFGKAVIVNQFNPDDKKNILVLMQEFK